MGGQSRDLIFSIFDWCPCLEGALCLLWRENHTKSCACKNLQDRKRRTKDVGQSGVRLWSQRVGHSSPRHGDGQLALRSGSRAVGGQYGVKNKDTKQWRRWPDESAFLLSYHDTHRECLKVPDFTFLYFAVLNPCLSVSSSQPLLFVILFFCTICEMSTRPGMRIKNGVYTTRLSDEQPKPTKTWHVCGFILVPTGVLNIALNHLMVRLQSWSFWECGIPLYYHYSHVHSVLEW